MCNMSDITIVDENNEPIEQVKEIATPPVIEQDGVMLREQVAKILFDFTPSEMASYKDKLENIIAYAKSVTDDHTVSGIKWAIRNLGMRLGTPPLGEKLINYLNIYAKLHLETIRLKAEKQKFLRKGDVDFE